MAIQNNPLYGYDKQWGENNLNQPNIHTMYGSTL